MQSRWPSSVVTSTPGNDQEIIDRQAVLAHQPFFEQVGDGVAGVVIGNREAMQTFLAGRRDVLLRARHAVARKEGVRVQVDVERPLRGG